MTGNKRNDEIQTEQTSADESILPETIQDELPPVVAANLATYKKQAHGLRHEGKKPNKEHISYPEKYSQVDRVLHVLWTQHLREHSISWIATAAAVDEDICKSILQVLATGGVVIQPSEEGADGYRLNPYYKQCVEIANDIDRIPQPTEESRG